MSNVRAINSNIIVDQFPDEEGSSILKIKDQRTFRVGKIVSTGRDVKHYSVGDVVIYAKDATFEVNYSEFEDNYLLLDSEEDIYAKVVD